jgi:16S rRNA G966 N2-methylase RsmD
MRLSGRPWVLVACAWLLHAAWMPHTGAQAAPATPLAAPFVATPDSIVDRMLRLAGVGASDFVVDLGSGDGRLVITAVAKYGARGGFGVEIDSQLVKISNANAERARIADRVRFIERDLFATDVREATLVTVYLLPAAMARLEKKLLAELRPGTRVVTHDYPFPNWPVDKIEEFDSLDKVRSTGTTTTRLWLYRVPEAK